jgi:hypothetical protein
VTLPTMTTPDRSAGFAGDISLLIFLDSGRRRSFDKHRRLSLR